MEAAVAAISASTWRRCEKCTPAKAAQLLRNIRAQALLTVSIPGTLNPCERWSKGFMLRKALWNDSDCVIESNVEVVANIGFTGRHVAVVIVLCNGYKLWVDNGAFGGSDHTCTPSDRPSLVCYLPPIHVWGYDENDCDPMWFRTQSPNTSCTCCPSPLIPESSTLEQQIKAALK